MPLLGLSHVLLIGPTFFDMEPEVRDPGPVKGTWSRPPPNLRLHVKTRPGGWLEMEMGSGEEMGLMPFISQGNPSVCSYAFS